MVTLFLALSLAVVIGAVLYYGLRSEYRGDMTKDAKVLTPYARDISVFTKKPTLVFFPKTVEDVVYLVKQAKFQQVKQPNYSLTVRAGGTCMSGGPLTESAVVDLTKYLNKVSINSLERTATVEMGAYFREVEAAAAVHGLMFAPYPSSRLICGIGGMIGNNASGEKSIRYGATSDNILSLEVVLADGSVVTLEPKPVAEAVSPREQSLLALSARHGEHLATAVGEVKKAASGYRLDKVVTEGVFNEIPLQCGAQGTLGIITKSVLKLVPIPEHLSLLAISAGRLEDIPVIVNEIFKWNPEAVETFDKNTFLKAREHLTPHAERLVPYVDTHAELFILAEFSEETKQATEEMTQGCLNALLSHGYRASLITDEVDCASAWEVRRNSFLLMRDHNPAGYKAVPCIEDVIVPIPALAEFIGGLHEILNRRGISYGFHGHIGDGSLRIVPVFDTTSPTLISDITGLMDDVFPLIKRLRGNISADHSDGIIRSPFLKDFYGDELYEAMVQIKRLYDPLGIMNPDKKINVPRAHIEKYFDRGR